jgi:hypothetical protein
MKLKPPHKRHVKIPKKRRPIRSEVEMTKAEKYIADAPCHYNASEASAWASGYNACLAAQADAPQSPMQRGKLTGDQIMEVIRCVTSGELRKMLTYKCWKDGIDIDQPTFAAEQLAEQFRAALADTRPDGNSQ